MSSKLDELRRRAEQAARQIDEKYEITSKLDKGARATTDALRKGAEAASSSIDSAREEVSRLDREHKVSERVSAGARRFDDAKEKASDLFGDARRYYENASGAARASASAARLPSSLLGTLASARRWAKKNPGKAAAVSLAFAGVMSPLLCAVLMPLSSLSTIAITAFSLRGRKWT